MLSGVRREIRSIPASSMLWSVLFSTTLVGVMLATEMGRIYRSQSSQSTRPAAPTFGASQRNEGRHGRHADTPWQIPLRGWKDILWRTYEQIGEDRLLAVAAGVVFYGLLAVFPAITALVSLYGLFASPSAIGDHLSILQEFCHREQWIF
jgi:membrane protein